MFDSSAFLGDFPVARRNSDDGSESTDNEQKYMLVHGTEEGTIIFRETTSGRVTRPLKVQSLANRKGAYQAFEFGSVEGVHDSALLVEVNVKSNSPDWLEVILYPHRNDFNMVDENGEPCHAQVVLKKKNDSPDMILCISNDSFR